MKRKGFLKLKPLHYEAIKLADLAPDMAELRKRDMTELFIEELKQRIKKKNLINIQIRGEQTSGKSLIGFVICLYILKLLKKEIKMHNICPDQFDFLDKMKDMDIKNSCFVIDEWNEMSTTGYNATTNQALLTQFNEVQAQRFNNKIACSPQKVLDQTSTIRLDVLEKDTEERTTTCLVSYVLSKESLVFEQLLGHIVLDVSSGLKHPLWNEYKKRKFERMNMLMKKGIMDTREGDDSKIILKVVEEMRDLAIVNGFVSRDVIRSFIKYVQDKFIAVSIYGEDKLTGTIYGILILLKSIYNVNQKINGLKKAIDKLQTDHPLDQVKMKPEVIHYRKKLEIWKQSKAKLAKTFEKSINYHQEVLDTLQRFAEIGSTEDIKKDIQQKRSK